MSLPSPFSQAHSNFQIDKKYSQCFSYASDNLLQTLAIVLFALQLFLIICYVLFTLFCWNKYYPFRVNTGVNQLFLVSMCVFQAVTFCVFYEFEMPPSIDLFLRHLYRFSTQWHGAFRTGTVSNYEDDPLFNFNFYRIVKEKAFDLQVVQSTFINSGILLIVLALLWVLGIILYFLFLRIKSNKKGSRITMVQSDPNLKDFPPSRLEIDIEEDEEIIEDPVLNGNLHPSFIWRFALSFGFLLPTMLSLSFTVEIMYYIFFEFYRANPKHFIFQISLAFTIFIFVCHILLIMYCLHYPFQFLKSIRSRAPQKPPQNLPNIKENESIYKEQLRIYNTKHADISFLSASPLRKVHAPFSWLFLIQGLKLTSIRPYFIGLVSILFVLYSAILVLLPVPAYVAVGINFGIITIVFLLILMFPLVNFLENIFMILGYLLFWIGYLLFLLLGLIFDSGGTRCLIGIIIMALFFAACVLLLIGVLYSMISFCKFQFAKNAQYTAQNVTNTIKAKPTSGVKSTVRSDKKGTTQFRLINRTSNSHQKE